MGRNIVILEEVIEEIQTGNPLAILRGPDGLIPAPCGVRGYRQIMDELAERLSGLFGHPGGGITIKRHPEDTSRALQEALR